MIVAVTPCQVVELFKLLHQVPGNIQMEVDGWGLRKFMSLFIRRFGSRSKADATRLASIANDVQYAVPA